MKKEFAGKLEVITGCMFSGKSEEMIRRLRRAQIAKLSVMSFKPLIDNRYDALSIASHSNQTIETTPVSTAFELWQIVENQCTRGVPDVVGIDEVQFLGLEIVQHIDQLVGLGVRVIVSGLDMDYRGDPFEPVPTLMALADSVLKLSAVCMVCGAPAIHTNRLTQGTDLIEVGALGAYDARCRGCFTRPS